MAGSRFMHYLFRSGLLFGFSFYILYLVRHGAILSYIEPRMAEGVKWSSIGLNAIAVYQAYLAVSSLWSRNQAACSCEDLPPFRLKALLIYGLFALPLALGFAIPDSNTGSGTAASKGMHFHNHGISRHGGAAELDKRIHSDKSTEPYAKLARELYRKDTVHVEDELFIETLTSMDLYLDAFIGKTIEISGFVYREERMEGSRFIAARSAGPAPFGIMVEYGGAAGLADGTWVKVTGSIGKTRHHGLDVMTVTDAKVERIKAPQTADVYPNPDF